MNSRSLLRAYLILFAIAIALTTLGLATSCPRVEDGHLVQGCGHVFVSSALSDHFLNWLLIGGAVALVGTVTALILGRRPTLTSAVVWLSAGILELAIPASWYTAPSLLTISLLGVSALAALVAIPAGVAMARPRGSAEPSATPVPSES